MGTPNGESIAPEQTPTPDNTWPPSHRDMAETPHGGQHAPVVPEAVTGPVCMVTPSLEVLMCGPTVHLQVTGVFIWKSHQAREEQR